MEWEKIVIEVMEQSLFYFGDPTKRVAWPYILSSILLSIYVFNSLKDKTLWSFNWKEMWLSKSALTDYSFWVFNAFVKVLLLAPYLIFGTKLAFYSNEWMINTFGYFEGFEATTLFLLLYSLVLVVVNDLGTYIVHSLFHFVPFLWRFHKVHHSATSLNPFTQYRIHPVELFVNNFKYITVFGLVTGLFDYLTASGFHILTFWGANVFSFAFLLFGSNLRHTPIPLKYFSWLENWLISPFQHQIHHSNNKEHHNKNMGSKLAVWDRIFGTLLRSDGVDKIDFGIGEGKEHYVGFWKNLFTPFLFNKK